MSNDNAATNDVRLNEHRHRDDDSELLDSPISPQSSTDPSATTADSARSSPAPGTEAVGQLGAMTSHVRLALPREASAIASVQRQVWSTEQHRAQAMADIPADAVAQAWLDAIVRPPDARCRVLVLIPDRPDSSPALGRHGEDAISSEAQDIDGAASGRSANDDILGFAAVQPSDDPDAEVSDGLVAEFCVADSSTMQDRDRLLHAVVDTLVADGFHRATWWIDSTSDSLREWLVETGWGADGAYRSFSEEGVEPDLKQIRLRTRIVDEPEVA